jgi:hypothetical protein
VSRLPKRAQLGVRVSSSRFVYHGTRRGIQLPRNYIIAENYRRFWDKHVDLYAGTDKLVLR